MKEIEGDYVQNPDGTWKRVRRTDYNPGIITRIIDWFKEIIILIKD